MDRVYLVGSASIADIADAIREKNPDASGMTIADMPQLIRDIESGGGGGDEVLYIDFMGNELILPDDIAEEGEGVLLAIRTDLENDMGEFIVNDLLVVFNEDGERKLYNYYANSTYDISRLSTDNTIVIGNIDSSVYSLEIENCTGIRFTGSAIPYTLYPIFLQQKHF